MPDCCNFAFVSLEFTKQQAVLKLSFELLQSRVLGQDITRRALRFFIRHHSRLSTYIHYIALPHTWLNFPGLLPRFLCTVSDQKLVGGKAWEWGLSHNSSCKLSVVCELCTLTSWPISLSPESTNSSPSSGTVPSNNTSTGMCTFFLYLLCIEGLTYLQYKTSHLTAFYAWDSSPHLSAADEELASYPGPSPRGEAWYILFVHVRNIPSF